MEHYKFVSACAAIAVTVGAFAIVAPPAHGKSRPVVVVANPDIVMRHIGYADLNLASTAGEVTLNRRVGGAISGLCQEATGANSLSVTTKLADRRCRTYAWGQARPQIANATQRARDVAFNGASTIAASAITIALPK